MVVSAFCKSHFLPRFLFIDHNFNPVILQQLFEWRGWTNFLSICASKEMPYNLIDLFGCKQLCIFCGLFLDALPPPVAAFANRHDLQLVQTVGVEEIIAVLLGLHQHPLVDVQSGIVNDIIRLDHFRLFNARLHAGRLAVEVRIAVGIILQDQLRADADAEAVEGVRTDLAGLVGALHHAVRLVIEIGRNGDILGSGGGRRANLFFLHQIAALIVGIAVVIDAGDLLLVAAYMLAHHLVEVVVLVGILFTLGGTALLQQVAQLHRLDVYIFIYIFSLFERMQ